MAAGKKNAKSNKTAHVLNLLTAPETEGGNVAVQTPEADAAPRETPPAPPQALVPPILEVARSNDEQLSEQIRSALEEELLADANESAAPEAAEEDVDIEAPVPPAEPEEPAEEPTPPAPVQKTPLPVEKAPAAPPRSALADTPTKDDVSYFNVMQALVEEKAPRYIQMFGLCSCPRCVADVKALTLNNLQPKYVTMRHADRIPMLTVYESRYSASVFSQLTHACKTVMDSPRHDKP